MSTVQLCHLTTGVPICSVRTIRSVRTICSVRTIRKYYFAAICHWACTNKTDCLGQLLHIHD